MPTLNESLTAMDQLNESCAGEVHLILLEKVPVAVVDGTKERAQEIRKLVEDMYNPPGQPRRTAYTWMPTKLYR